MKKQLQTEQGKAALVRRINHYTEELGLMLDEYERKNPNWCGQALIWIINYGLRNLQKSLDTKDKRKSSISWKSPYLGLHYFVDWDPKLYCTGNVRINSGHLTAENIRTKRIACATLNDIMVRQITFVALQELTNNVAFEKREDFLTPILIADAIAFLNGIKNAKRRKQVFDDFFQPFAIGGCFEFDEDEFRPNEPVSDAVMRRFTQSQKQPTIVWHVTVDGHEMDVSLIFQVSALVLDFDSQKAYFPITVGLNFLPKGPLSKKAAWANPANWSRKDLSKFWNLIFADLNVCITKSTPPNTPEVEEAIVSLNAKIKVNANHDDPAAFQAIIDKMLQTFSKTGQVIQSEFDIGPCVPQADAFPWSRLKDSDFERLLFNLVGSERGYENPEWLTHTNAPDKGRDISVYRAIVDPLSGTRRFRIVVQCKHTKSVGIGDVSQLKEQMALWEPPLVDELIIATSGRFSSDAIQWVEKHNLSGNGLRIHMWPNSHLERLLARRPQIGKQFRK